MAPALTSLSRPISPPTAETGLDTAALPCSISAKVSTGYPPISIQLVTRTGHSSQHLLFLHSFVSPTSFFSLYSVINDDLLFWKCYAIVGLIPLPSAFPTSSPPEEPSRNTGFWFLDGHLVDRAAWQEAALPVPRILHGVGRSISNCKTRPCPTLSRTSRAPRARHPPPTSSLVCWHKKSPKAQDPRPRPRVRPAMAPDLFAPSGRGRLYKAGLPNSTRSNRTRPRRRLRGHLGQPAIFRFQLASTSRGCL